MANKKPPAAGKGRPKGALNKNTVEVQTFAREFLSDPKGVQSYRQQYQDGKLPPAVWQLLMHYAYGKPKDTLEVQTPVALEIPILYTREDILAVRDGTPDAEDDDDDGDESS